MILQFKFANSYSFYEETTIDFIASSQTELTNNYFPLDENNNILKTIAIYGPNASGKSNIIKSIKDFQNFISSSFKVDYNELPFKKFMYFDDEFVEFEISFLINKKQYKYGYTVSKDKIHYEWLYGQLNKNMVSILERENNEFKLHSSIGKVYKDILDEVELSNKTLLLSFLAKFGKIESIKKVFNYLTNNIHVLDNLDIDSQLYAFKEVFFKENTIDKFKDQFIKILNGFGLKIEDIKLEKSDPEKEAEMYFMHNFGNGKWINLNNESMGTKKLVTMLINILHLLSQETVLIIDELDSHLHPLLTRNINKLINDLDNYSQMLFTTHDVTLLENNILRRDQIYFTDKDADGCSEIIQLSQYKDENDNKVRKDVSFSNNYLAGIFGSIPKIELNFLNKEEQ